MAEIRVVNRHVEKQQSFYWPTRFIAVQGVSMMMLAFSILACNTIAHDTEYWTQRFVVMWTNDQLAVLRLFQNSPAAYELVLGMIPDEISIADLVNIVRMAALAGLIAASVLSGLLIILITLSYRRFVLDMRRGLTASLPDLNFRTWGRPGKTSSLIGSSASRTLIGFYLSYGLFFVLVFLLSLPAFQDWIWNLIKHVIVSLLSVSVAWSLISMVARYAMETSNVTVQSRFAFSIYDYLNTWLGLVTGLLSGLTRIAYGLISLFLFFAFPSLAVISWKPLRTWDSSYYQWWSMIVMDSYYFNPILRFAAYCFRCNALEIASARARLSEIEFRQYQRLRRTRFRIWRAVLRSKWPEIHVYVATEDAKVSSIARAFELSEIDVSSIK